MENEQLDIPEEIVVKRTELHLFSQIFLWLIRER